MWAINLRLGRCCSHHSSAQSRSRQWWQLEWDYLLMSTIFLYPTHEDAKRIHHSTASSISFLESTSPSTSWFMRVMILWVEIFVYQSFCILDFCGLRVLQGELGWWRWWISHISWWRKQKSMMKVKTDWIFQLIFWCRCD